MVKIKKKKIEDKILVFKEIDGVEEILQDGTYPIEVKILPQCSFSEFDLIIDTDKNGNKKVSIGKQNFSDEQLENFIFNFL